MARQLTTDTRRPTMTADAGRDPGNARDGRQTSTCSCAIWTSCDMDECGRHAGPGAIGCHDRSTQALNRWATYRLRFDRGQP